VPHLVKERSNLLWDNFWLLIHGENKVIQAMFVGTFGGVHSCRG
jgi:hypothetical protein